MAMPSRKQNKSCDECRRSRIACDAHAKSGLACSNCIRRGRTCSTKWLTKREEDRAQLRQRRTLALEQVQTVTAQDTFGNTASSPTSCHATERRDPALRLHHALWEIFISLFEPQLGLWIGNDCNPFKRMTTAPKTLVSRLMVTLDSARCSVRPDPIVAEMLRLPATSLNARTADDKNESRINQALMSAVHAFSARWLPTEVFKKAGQTDETARKRLMQTLWDQAHQNVLHILTLPSYRSILALYLFAITPSSSSTSMQPVAQLCYETSLRHYLQLRLESRITDRQAQDVSSHSEELGHLEDSAYWFGLVCDVSRSLLRCQPPVLLSGACSRAQVWTLVSQQISSFAAQHVNTGSTSDVLDDGTVLRILQLGSSCKTMCWAAITDVQDSLFYHRTSLNTEAALTFALSRLQQFEAVFSPLLEKVARDFVLIDEKSQLGYVWLVLHFHLGVLILADTLVAASTTLSQDTDVSMVSRRLGSVRSIVNVISLVRQYDHLNPQQSSLLLRDPYPEHASNALSRAAKSIVSLVRTDIISTPAAKVLASAISQGLQIVSRISFSAAQALGESATLFQNNHIALSNAQTSFDIRAAGHTSITLDSTVTPEMLENETIKELGQQAASDPSLMVKTIERSEWTWAGSTPDFGLDYLQFIDFTAVVGDWDFEDVFSGG